MGVARNSPFHSVSRQRDRKSWIGPGPPCEPDGRIGSQQLQLVTWLLQQFGLPGRSTGGSTIASGMVCY
jgi:hypothetical protein